jgi:hypothetical protein
MVTACWATAGTLSADTAAPSTHTFALRKTFIIAVLSPEE